MVFRDGLRRMSFLRFPDCQLRYCVESAVAQNFLSLSSLLNSGSFFFVSVICLRFVPVHVPGRYDSYEFSPGREYYKKAPASGSRPEGVVSLLTLRMPEIATYYERLLKKDVFRFLRSHLVAFPVLVGIGIVPVKPDALVQWIACYHKSSIRLSYTWDQDARRLVRIGVSNVIDANANAQRRIFLRILNLVSVLPRIAQIHVMANSHN
jgi:hypothetical protein